MYNILPFIRTSGVGAPLFSLSSENDYGIGDFKSAYLFIDFLENSSQSLWKFLPIHETSAMNSFSPYDPISAFALDPIYIDVEAIPDFPFREKAEEIKILRIELHQHPIVDYQNVLKFKKGILKESFLKFLNDEYRLKTTRAKAFQDFTNLNSYWVNDYALFKALQEYLNEDSFDKWPEEYMKREKTTITNARQELKDEIIYHMYVQWLLHIQLQSIHSYAQKKSVYLLGDISFYIGLHSVDVWSHPEFFDIDESFRPLSYGGAPADGFSSEQQKWECAVYRWDVLKNDQYLWQFERIQHDAQYFDGLRLDHFRGYIKYWKIDLSLQGHWEDGPGINFLNKLMKKVDDNSLCLLFGENLGDISNDVESARMSIGIDGYIVFIFSYSDILLHNVAYNNIVETTTHDTPPLKAWWSSLQGDVKKEILEKLRLPVYDSSIGELNDEVRFKIIEHILSMPFDMSIIPIQDILGSSVVMNTPGTRKGNWEYRIERNIEALMRDSNLLSRLDSYSSMFNLNKYFSNFTISTQPPIKRDILRQYKVGEMIHVWAFTEYESDLLAVTNVTPDKGVPINQEYSFRKIQSFDLGVLYEFHTKVKIPGEFYLTIKHDGRYIGEFEEDMKMIIED